MWSKNKKKKLGFILLLLIFLSCTKKDCSRDAITRKNYCREGFITVVLCPKPDNVDLKSLEMHHIILDYDDFNSEERTYSFEKDGHLCLDRLELSYKFGTPENNKVVVFYQGKDFAIPLNKDTVIVME